ncbi:MAG: NAD(P)(+) transhydrogenase (Re/Si-specific) subunit alpha [Treponema sp.]|nr:MAG: NAD(P)(+) transhydrogenase (Re/Si-specific) subunit alpha [Treponema sp.]
MIIGVPKEIMEGENRVAATPETCAAFVKDGHTMLIEKGAGEGAFFYDEEYKKAGAELIEDVKTIFDKAELILKVKEPQFNKAKNCHEVEMMHKGQFLITFIHPAAPGNHQMVKDLAAQGVTAFTLDSIPRNENTRKMDALISMSICAGYKGFLMGANLLPRFVSQIDCAVGTIKPIKVLAIGTGVAGSQALTSAKSFGADIYAVDFKPEAAERAKKMGAEVIDINVSASEAMAENGNAKNLEEATLKRTQDILAKHITDMDIVFTTALVPGKVAPILITEEMVKMMKPGSVIVDISIDQGGNCELTDPGKISVKHGVNIIGTKNIPGLIPESSTWMFSQNIYNIAKHLIKNNTIEVNLNDEIVNGTLTVHDGKVVHKGALEAMGM